MAPRPTMTIPEVAKVLGIPGRKSLNGIHTRVRELAKEWHPDSSGQDPDLAHVMFLRIREAYDLPPLEYGINYEISFLARDIWDGTHYDTRDFWKPRFGADPIWSKNISRLYRMVIPEHSVAGVSG